MWSVDSDWLLSDSEVGNEYIADRFQCARPRRHPIAARQSTLGVKDNLPPAEPELEQRFCHIEIERPHEQL